MRRRTKLWVPVVVMIGVIAAGCSSGSKSATSGGSATTAKPANVTGSITVSDAASLTNAFARIGTDFTRGHRNATVKFNPGSSATLATQILNTNGAGVDVFASADTDNMGKLATANRINGTPVVFAKNRLTIVTKPGNPKQIKALADLGKANVVSLCGLTVPCGKYAAQMLQKAGITIPETKVTRGVDVKGTLAAVTTGDADAAIVYVTDAKTAGRSVSAVTIPDAQYAVATYPIAILAGSANQAVSRAFIDYVTSSRGQATLKSFGFLPPS